MDANQLITLLAVVSGVLFVISSMLAMGMSLTLAAILQPLRSPGRVALALVANFALVPLVAWLITLVVPRALGLLIRAHAPETGERWAATMSTVSSISMLALIVLGLGLNVSTIVDLVGSFGFLALLLFIAGALLVGTLLGRRERGARRVMMLGTAQRNVSAAVVVATQSFAGTMTLPYVLVAAACCSSSCCRSRAGWERARLPWPPGGSS